MKSPMMFRKNKQQGFVGIIILIIVLAGVVMMAFSYMNQGTNTNSTEQTAKSNASVIIKQAVDYKIGFDRLMSNGIDHTTVTFDTTAGTGLFDPALGYARLQVAPPVSMTTAKPYTYNSLVTLANVGTTAPESTLTLGPLTQATCEQINKTLYNDKTLPTTTASLVQWTSSPAAIADGTGGGTFVGRAEGCVKTSDAAFVYYKALSEN